METPPARRSRSGVNNFSPARFSWDSRYGFRPGRQHIPDHSQTQLLAGVSVLDALRSRGNSSQQRR